MTRGEGDADDLDDIRSVPGPVAVWWRAAALGLATVFGVAVAVTLDLPSVPEARAWLDTAGPAVWAAIVLALAAALVTPAPRSAMSVFVGAVAGFPTGLTVVVLAGILGGLAGYGLSRWLGGPAFVRLAGDRLGRAEAFLERRGFLAVVAARVSPIPFVIVSYAAGLTGVPMTKYLLGTSVGVLPGSVVYVGVGASLSLLTPWAARLPVIGVGLVVLTAVAVTGVLLWRRGRASPHR